MHGGGVLSRQTITDRNDAAPDSTYKNHIETFSVIGEKRQYSNFMQC